MERVLLVWSILVEAAGEHQTMTYGQLAERVGGIARGMGHLLKPIEDYCIRQGLPPLTVLVVRSRTGLPGPGFRAVTITSRADLVQFAAQVYETDWSNILVDAGNFGS